MNKNDYKEHESVVSNEITPMNPKGDILVIQYTLSKFK